MNYPVVIHKDENSDDGVTVPDLPGCFSGGTTLDDAIAMAREAVELHLEGVIEDGQPIPHPAGIEQHQRKPVYRGGVWAVVSIDPGSLRLEAKRINITMPERILDSVDRLAAREGENRSGLLVRAVTAYMGRGAARRDRARTRTSKR